VVVPTVIEALATSKTCTWVTVAFGLYSIQPPSVPALALIWVLVLVNAVWLDGVQPPVVPGVGVTPWIPLTPIPRTR
jgi:hypothetical protein